MLAQSDVASRAEPGGGGRLAREFAQLLEDMWDGSFTAVAPFRFKLALSKIAPQFSGYQQQDAHELLVFLTQQLHEELDTAAAAAAAGAGDEVRASDGYRPLITAAHCCATCLPQAVSAAGEGDAAAHWAQQMRSSYSIIAEVFYVRWRQSTRFPVAPSHRP